MYLADIVTPKRLVARTVKVISKENLSKITFSKKEQRSLHLVSTGREFIVTWLQKTSHHPLASFSPDQLTPFPPTIGLNIPPKPKCIVGTP